MLEPYGINVHVVPSGGGWRYEQPMPQGPPQRIPPKNAAETATDLVKQARLFRAVNGIPDGDVEFDVAEFISKVSPHNRRPILNQKQRNAPKEWRNNIDRITEWLIASTRRRLRLVLSDVADKRAEACLGCRQNVAWRTGCAPCCEGVTYRGQNLRQRASYKHDEKLMACRLHGIYLPAAIFLARESLSAFHPDAPAECWLRNESP